MFDLARFCSHRILYFIKFKPFIRALLFLSTIWRFIHATRTKSNRKIKKKFNVENMNFSVSPKFHLIFMFKKITFFIISEFIFSVPLCLGISNNSKNHNSMHFQRVRKKKRITGNSNVELQNKITLQCSRIFFYRIPVSAICVCC